jgi:hypothetical protein
MRTIYVNLNKYGMSNETRSFFYDSEEEALRRAKAYTDDSWYAVAVPIQIDGEITTQCGNGPYLKHQTFRWSGPK